MQHDIQQDLFELHQQEKMRVTWPDKEPNKGNKQLLCMHWTLSSVFFAPFSFGFPFLILGLSLI